MTRHGFGLRALRRSRAFAGFTLLELLVVIAILSIVSAVGTSAFVTVTSAWNEARALADLDRQAQAAFSSIRRDLADTLSSELSGIAIGGSNGQVQDERTFPAAHNANDRLAIPIQGTDSARALQVAMKVGYFVDRDSPSHPLIRSVGEVDEAFPAGARQDVIPGARTVAFRVEYQGRGGRKLWLPEWTATYMPSAVRVSLTLEDPDRPEFQISRKTVMAVHVR